MFTKSDSAVYTVAEIQQMLGISRTKAYEICYQKLFPVKRIGKKILIPKQPFDDWFKRIE